MMRQYLFLVLGLLATIACRGTPELESEAEHVVAFVDVNVVPMDSERVVQHQNVIVSDDRIVRIGPVSDV